MGWVTGDYIIGTISTTTTITTTKNIYISGFKNIYFRFYNLILKNLKRKYFFSKLIIIKFHECIYNSKIIFGANDRRSLVNKN